MPCTRDIFSVEDITTKDIYWATNWTSEFYLEANSRRVEVGVQVSILVRISIHNELSNN